MKRLAHPMSTFSCCVLIFLHAMVPIGHKFFMHSHDSCAPCAHTSTELESSCCDDQHESYSSGQSHAHEHDDCHSCCGSSHDHASSHEQTTSPQPNNDTCSADAHSDGEPCQHDCDEDCPLCAMSLVKFMLPLGEPHLVLATMPDESVLTPRILWIARGPDCVRERGPPIC